MSGPRKRLKDLEPGEPSPYPERMPEHMGYVNLANVDAALRDFQHALDAERASDQVLYLKRARSALLAAERNAMSTRGEWRGYNNRLDRLVAFLEEHEETEGSLW